MTEEAWDVHEAALVGDAYRAHELYDKTIIALSGGALGVSLVFAHDIVGDTAGRGWLWLLGAWTLWTLSLSATASTAAPGPWPSVPIAPPVES